jgi:hypothetical protein
LQSFIIKEPLEIDYDNDSIDEIVEKVEARATLFFSKSNSSRRNRGRRKLK